MSPKSQQTRSLVTIGRVLKPFGVKGEVRVESLTDVPGRFEELKTVTLELPGGQLLEATVITVRKNGRGYLLGLSACTTPEEAAPFRGAWIKVPVHPNLPREKDVYYQFELIGLDVHDEEGNRVGILEEVLDYPQHHVFVIRNHGNETLIPATKKTIEMIDTEQNILRVRSRESWGHQPCVVKFSPSSLTSFNRSLHTVW